MAQPNSLDITTRVVKTVRFYTAIGEYSDLWPAKWVDEKDGKQKLAVKVLRGASSDRPQFIQEFRERLLQEAATWKKFDHENIAPFHGIACNFGLLPGIVLDFYDYSLRKYLQKNRVDTEQKIQWVNQIASGMKFLHRQRPVVLHGDLRANNIFIVDDGKRCVIADTGVAFLTTTDEFTSLKTVGTSRWTAPELIDPTLFFTRENPVPTIQTDVFSFAMTIIEIFSENLPYEAKKSDSAIIFAILRGERPPIPESLEGNTTMINLLAACWFHHPRYRPDFITICCRLGQVSFFMYLLERIGIY